MRRFHRMSLISADLPSLCQLSQRDEIHSSRTTGTPPAHCCWSKSNCSHLPTCLCASALYGGVLIWNYPRWFSVGGAMIELMGSPFRYNKKERKRLRRFAKKVATTADKFETEGTKPNAVAVLRRLAESNIAIAKGRKKKKPKNPN